MAEVGAEFDGVVDGRGGIGPEEAEFEVAADHFADGGEGGGIGTGIGSAEEEREAVGDAVLVGVLLEAGGAVGAGAGDPRFVGGGRGAGPPCGITVDSAGPLECRPPPRSSP